MLSILFVAGTLFILTTFVMAVQKRLVKSLKQHSNDELVTLRKEYYKNYQLAREAKRYGAMGHQAENIVKVTQELTNRGLSALSKQPLLQLVDSESNVKQFEFDKVVAL